MKSRTSTICRSICNPENLPANAHALKCIDNQSCPRYLTEGYLHRLIWNLAEHGVAVLLISSDMPEMVLLTDRVVVMKGMQIVGDLPNSRQYEVMSRRIMHCIHESECDLNIEDGVLASQGA